MMKCLTFLLMQEKDHKQVVINDEPLGEINLVKEINATKTDGWIGDAYLPRQ